MAKTCLTAAERLRLIEKPYLTQADICKVLSKPSSTVSDWIKRSDLKRYGGFGYLTDDVIKAFQLSGAIKRWRANA